MKEGDVIYMKETNKKEKPKRTINFKFRVTPEEADYIKYQQVFYYRKVLWNI